MESEGRQEQLDGRDKDISTDKKERDLTILLLYLLGQLLLHPLGIVTRLDKVPACNKTG